MSRGLLGGNDLTAREKDHVRVALRVLSARGGGRKVMAKVLRYSLSTISHVLDDKVTVSPALMLRVARTLRLSVDDLLAGKYPPVGVCRHCGRPADGSRAAQ